MINSHIILHYVASQNIQTSTSNPLLGIYAKEMKKDIFKNVISWNVRYSIFNNNKQFPSANFVNFQLTIFSWEDYGISMWQPTIKPIFKMLIFIKRKNYYA